MYCFHDFKFKRIKNEVVTLPVTDVNLSINPLW